MQGTLNFEADADRKLRKKHLAKSANKDEAARLKKERKNMRGSKGKKERTRRAVPKGSAQWRQCASKVYFPNAARAREGARASWLWRKDYLYVYKCLSCDGWHITHRRKGRASGLLEA